MFGRLNDLSFCFGFLGHVARQRRSLLHDALVLQVTSTALLAVASRTSPAETPTPPAPEAAATAPALPEAPSALLHLAPDTPVQPAQPRDWPSPEANAPATITPNLWWKAGQTGRPLRPGENPNAYHWRGLIWQSIEFNVIENGFRAAADPVIRDTLAHRPFFHDYWASMNHFNMRRWNDGDTFIVNYIGHSLHGAVASYLEIQNSPEQARLQWGDPGYTQSRFKGFLWATVFSTHSEISPAGEAGFGNEGGFTYGKNCLYKCNSSNFHRGDKFTNNTGWVDFIVTPTAGTVWVVTEDLIERYLTQPLVLRNPTRFWPMLVRGGLNPGRSFANMLRWQTPWYRDFEQPVTQSNRVYWYPPEDEAAFHRLPRLQLAPFYSGFTIASNSPGCFNCRTTATGGGLQTTLKLRGWLGLDTSISYHPHASALPSDRAGGNMLAAFFGLSATKQWHYYAVHAALRPGMVRYSNAYLRSPQTFTVLTSPPRISTHGGDADTLHIPGVIDANGTPNQPPLGPIHHFTWDWQLAGDYRLTNHLALRLGLEDAITRYRTDKVDAPGIGTPPYLSWLSKEQYINRGNFVLQAGPVFSF